MKKSISLLIVVTLLSIQISAQTAVKIWSTEPDLKVPESVLFDAKNQR